MAYIDAYIIPVARARLETYVTSAKEMAALWIEHGALRVTESLGDDVPLGTLTSFPRSVMATDDEVVFLSHVSYRDRAHRDQVNAAVMQDKRMGAIMAQSDIDGKRMIWGGFEVVVSA